MGQKNVYRTIRLQYSAYYSISSMTDESAAGDIEALLFNLLMLFIFFGLRFFVLHYTSILSFPKNHRESLHLSIHHAMAKQPEIVSTMVNKAKQHPDDSNIKRGWYMRDSIVNSGENSRSIRVLRPIV